MLIDLFCSDLVAGYKEIVITRQALLKKWRFDLLRAYSQRREHYARQLAQREARKALYQRALPFIGFILILVCGAGAWMTLRSVDLACLGMVLMLGAGFGVLVAMGAWMGLSRTPPPPENPVTRTSQEEAESPLRQKLFPKLVPLWRREMAVRVPTEAEAEQLAVETGKWGLIGEFDLIRALEGAVSPETYILHSLKPRSGDDMDVVVIGPKGFWYFEVKHWNADFIWHNGTWEVWQLDPTTQNFEQTAVRENPDAQWARMRDEALANLRASGASGASLLKRAPVLGNIQGGIVFSHPDARIQIDRLAPFRYGTIEQWVATYQAAPRLKEVTAGRALHLLEILLKRHQSFYPETELYSMKEDAITSVIAEVEAGIQAWIEEK
jgi:hypothetical protein